MAKINNLEDLTKFIFSVRWEYDFNITPDTKINEDLKIFGDDATEFIIAYGKKFNVDVSKFMASDYFEDESLFTFIFKSHKKKKILTINHLLKGIEYGRLDEEIINN